MKLQVEPGIMTRIRWPARKVGAKLNEVRWAGRLKLNPTTCKIMNRTVSRTGNLLNESSSM